MSQMLKCPNPSCPYVFDPSGVPVGVVLSCPRCGMQFAIGPPQSRPPANYPVGYGAAAPPANTELETLGETTVRERDLDDLLPTRGTNKAQFFILAGIAAVLMAGTSLALFFFIMNRGETISQDTATKLQELNIAMDKPPAGWVRDDNTRVKIGSPYFMSYRRENPEAYMAFGASESDQGRSPRRSEMHRYMMAPFAKLFDSTSLRQESPVISEWLGQGIELSEPFNNGFKFRAQSNDGLTWVGETYTVANKGIAYYWLIWSGENDYDGVKGEFAEFRKKFKLLGGRKDWKEERSNVIDFKGDTVHYTISDAEELWKEVSGADVKALKETEPDLEKRLRMYLTPRGDRKARPDEAELSVYVLSGGGNDPTETARQYARNLETIRIKQANSAFAPPTFTELPDSEPLRGDPLPDNIAKNTKAVRVVSNIKESKSANRLIVTSGIKLGDKTVVVVCWSEATKRDPFESKFVQIAESLRPSQ